MQNFEQYPPLTLIVVDKGKKLKLASNKKERLFRGESKNVRVLCLKLPVSIFTIFCDQCL